MKQDEIIAMAVSCGFSDGLAMRGTTRNVETMYKAWPEEVEAFAKLVSAKEREAMAQEQADARMDRTFTERD